MRRREREIKRKLLYYLKSEEERLTREREEEEARKREGNFRASSDIIRCKQFFTNDFGSRNQILIKWTIMTLSSLHVAFHLESNRGSWSTGVSKLTGLLIFISFCDLAEEERRKKREADQKAKLDAMAEKQRQRERELEEKERVRREALRRPVESLPRPADPASAQPSEPIPVAAAGAAVPTAAAAASTSKYIPRYLRERSEAQRGPPPPEPERRGFGTRAAPSDSERRGSRQDDRPAQSDDWRSSKTSSSSSTRPSLWRG